MAGEVLQDNRCSPGMRMGGIFESPPKGCPGRHKAGGPCFPAAATVITRDGTVKAMEDLAVGDEVQTINSNGIVSFEQVYFFGHRNRAVDITEYIGFDVMSLDAADGRSRQLWLTGGHFIPVIQRDSATRGCAHSRAFRCVPQQQVNTILHHQLK